MLQRGLIFSRLMVFFGEKMLPCRENVPEYATNSGETTAAEEICPGKHPKTGRNHGRRGEMSWKMPQNREKPRQRQRNVPENAPKPGETTAAEVKCPGNNHNFGRNYLSGRKSGENGEKIWLTPQLSLLSRAQNFFETIHIV